MLATLVFGGFSLMLLTAISAILSDRYGRRTVILVGLGLALPWSLALIPIVNIGHPASFAVALLVSTAISGIVYGPLAAFLPELFPTAHRYTSTALAFNIAGVVAGAVAPVLPGVLVATTGSWAIGLMMAAVVVISLVAGFVLPDTRMRTLNTV